MSTATHQEPDRAQEAAPDIWNDLLQHYVEGEYFNYARLKASAEDQARFRRFLAWQATADVSAMSRNAQIAFYINAYNASNVKMILDHYPVHSPKDIPGFFDKIKHPVAGEQLTIAEIEYTRLIANYKDMRAHFAVVCSDRGCLPLKNSAYTGDSLDRDLEADARKFVADKRQFKVDKKTGEVQISKIFDWYGKKFTKDPKRPAAKPELYLTYWVDPDTRKFLQDGNYKLRFIDWNWTINER